MGRFKLLTKELKSYSRDLFKNIYELEWDYKLNKPIIKNSTEELRFLELADKYYLFDIDQCKWDPKHSVYPDPNHKLDVIADKIKEGTVLVSLTDDGHIKGYCRYSINVQDKSVFIEELFTVKEFQRMGVADKLLSYVEKRAILQKCNLMMLYVHSNNLGAIAFYNKFGLIEPKDVMFSVTPTYSAYIYKEIAEIWEKKFSFVNNNDSDLLRWYGQIKHDKGKGNCLDYGMYVAYIASKLHNAKVVITNIGFEQNTKTNQIDFHHIIPIYYEDGNWVLVNYMGANNDNSILYTFAGKDDIETVIKFVDKYSKEWLPILSNCDKLDYNTCNKVIKIATVEKVKSTLNKYYGQNVTQSEVLDYLFSENNYSKEELIIRDDERSVEDYSSSKKKKYSKNNKREVTGRRRFKCEDCGQRFGTFDQLFKHATKMHSDLINNEDPYKYLFDKRNPGIKLCVICKKNTCEWNPVKYKYARYCTNPECKKKAREMFQKNMKRIYGTDNLLNDPEHQAEMLANRKISGKYTWQDGVQIIYVGRYELDFLQYCENTLHFASSDVVPFPTNMSIKYLDKFTNVERFYIPDFWIPSLNLAIEIKDGSKYPLDSKAKMAMKEEAVIKLDKFNFIKIVDKDYSDFNDLIKTLKDLNCAEVKKDGNHIFIIPAPSNNSL